MLTFELNIFWKSNGFNDKWLDWIGFGISTVKFSVLINGSPHGYSSLKEGFEAMRPPITLYICFDNGNVE